MPNFLTPPYRLARTLAAFFILSQLILISACSHPNRQALQDISGKTHALETLKKNWLIINYWASWCAPCREEVPELNKLAQQNPTWNVLAVNFDTLTPPALTSEAQKLGFQFPVLLNDPSELLKLERPQALPSTFIFAPGLQLYQVLRGPQTAEGLNKIIKGSNIE